MTEPRRGPWGLFQLLAVIAALIGGFVLWGLYTFGSRDIPPDAPACPREDWATLNAQGVEFGSFYNSTDRRERERPNGVLAERGPPYPRCIEIFGDKTCNLTGPTRVQVNRPDGPVVIALAAGQSARLRNSPNHPFVCGLIEAP